MQNLRSRRGRSALHHQHILDAHRNARQRGQWIALRRQRVDLRGLSHRALFGQAQVDIQPRIDRLDAVIIAVGEIRGLGAAAGNRRTQLGQSLWLLYVGFRCFGFAGQSGIPFVVFL